jgi:hypothetical protein
MIIVGQDSCAVYSCVFNACAAMVISQEELEKLGAKAKTRWHSGKQIMVIKLPLLYTLLQTIFQVRFIITWHGFSNSRTFISLHSFIIAAISGPRAHTQQNRRAGSAHSVR